MSWVLHGCLGELTYSSPFSFRRLFCVFTKLMSFMLPNFRKWTDIKLYAMQKAQLLVRIFQTFLLHSSKYISNRHSSLLYLVF